MRVNFADGATVRDVVPKDAIRQGEERRWPERQMTHDEPIRLSASFLHHDHVRKLARSARANKFTNLENAFQPDKNTSYLAK